ncbi:MULTISPECIES: DedA family protein [Rhodopseudomonas]|uniref:Membrane protein n=1 Tax=Rhodopseudomonas palustris TaxID=1076 RepID=A0A0D7F4P7_RHOPL|nr:MULTISPECIES: DedA family protein [Rhodopseudomonas]KIZ48073.1 membrane protein [Rhodopseudomonas palustris]MDF3812139.1 DedA family protein [Rhodopseudomonas sp. BAL398]WOK16620.1 DedA family protein [Rhodopseudomonas sp. BAL398]
MSAFLEHLIEFASAHAGLAYLIVFLSALLEAVPLLGSVIPGSTIILALSALIPGGHLNVVLVIAAAVAGAVIGDAAAYWTGHRGQRRILGAWPMARYPLLVARSEAFFLRYGAWAVFFARFVAPVRALVPVTAGALGMAPGRFFAVNLPAIALWAPAHVLPGLIAATVLAKPHQLGLHHLLPVLAGAVTTALLALWAWRRWRKASADLSGRDA